jgi:phosphate transport system substrate-binding protein
VGGSCRHRLIDENNNVVPEEADVKMIHVAWDALVFIVNKQNKVDNLTVQQAKDIFSGKITDWSEVGGSDGRIDLLVREGKISGVGYIFRNIVMQNKDFEFPNFAKNFRSSGPLEKNIEHRGTNAIAVTGISSAKKRDVKIIRVEDVYPSKENISSGKYPFFRPLYLVVEKKYDKKTKQFVNFVLNDEGQNIISNEGTVNLREGASLRDKWYLASLSSELL